jgi:hypothetical protein
MTRVESRRRHQAAPPTQPHLNRPMVHAVFHEVQLSCIEMPDNGD